MARDEEFLELATRFPEAALLLLGIAPTGHDGRSIEVKQSKRQIDVVFVPRTPDGDHEPIQVVLTDLDPERLERQGGREAAR